MLKKLSCDRGLFCIGISPPNQRYTTPCSLDASFERDGLVATPVDAYDAEGCSVILQPYGKIVVAGWSIVPYSTSLVPRMPAYELDQWQIGSCMLFKWRKLSGR